MTHFHFFHFGSMLFEGVRQRSPQSESDSPRGHLNFTTPKHKMMWLTQNGIPFQMSPCCFLSPCCVYMTVFTTYPKVIRAPTCGALPGDKQTATSTKVFGSETTTSSLLISE